MNILLVIKWAMERTETTTCYLSKRHSWCHWTVLIWLYRDVLEMSAVAAQPWEQPVSDSVLCNMANLQTAVHMCQSTAELPVEIKPTFSCSWMLNVVGTMTLKIWPNLLTN